MLPHNGYGAEIVQVVETDKSGNHSTPKTIVIELKDTTAPTVTFDTVSGNSSITAAEKSDGVTLEGNTEVGATVHLSFGTEETPATGEVIVDESGHWSYDLTADDVAYDKEVDGSLTINVTAEDTAGNITKQAEHQVVVVPDTTPPAVPEFAAMDIVDDSGDYPLKGTVDVSGESDPESITISLTFGDKPVRTGIPVDADGNWEYQPATEDLYTFVKTGSGRTATYTPVEVTSIAAEAVDKAGNHSVSADFTIPLPMMDILPEITSADGNVKDGTITLSERDGSGAVISGTAEIGASIKLTFADDSTVNAGVAKDDGTWSYTLKSADFAKLEADGSITATASLLGVQNATSDAFQVAVDFSAPTAAPTAATDVKVLGDTNGDGVLNIAEAGTSVKVTANGVDANASATLRLNDNSLTTADGVTVTTDASQTVTFTVPKALLTGATVDSTFVVGLENSVNTGTPVLSEPSAGFKVDFDAPAAPTVGASGGKISISGLEDGASYTYTIKGSAPVTDKVIAGKTTALIDFPAGVSSLAAKDVTATQTDKAGNPGVAGSNDAILQAGTLLTGTDPVVGKAGSADVFIYNVTSSGSTLVGQNGDVQINGFEPLLDKILLVDSAGLLKSATSLDVAQDRSHKTTMIDFDSKVVPATTAGAEDQTFTQSITLNGVVIADTISSVLLFA